VRIPLGDDEKGIVGSSKGRPKFTYYWFIPEYNLNMERLPQYLQYCESMTFGEFKEKYPHVLYQDTRYRTDDIRYLDKTRRT
jgi:hypothetical protein